MFAGATVPTHYVRECPSVAVVLHLWESALSLALSS